MNSWGTIIFLILAFGLPALGKVANKINEQRKLKEIRDERESRRVEMLRTGRVEVEQIAPITQKQQQADRSLEQLAERRKAQLAQLRQQQQQRAQQLRQRIQQKTARPPAASAAATAPPPIPIPQVTIGASAQPAQRRRPSRLTPAQRAEAQRRIAQMKAPAAPKSVAKLPLAEQKRTLGRIAQQRTEPVKKTRTVEPISGLIPKSAADWRRAIVAKELLSPPVALRDPSGPADPIG